MYEGKRKGYDLVRNHAIPQNRGLIELRLNDFIECKQGPYCYSEEASPFRFPVRNRHFMLSASKVALDEDISGRR